MTESQRKMDEQMRNAIFDSANEVVNYHSGYLDGMANKQWDYDTNRILKLMNDELTVIQKHRG